jgi:hypothetical protein
MDTNNRLRAIWRGLTSCGRNTEFVVESDLNTFDRRLACDGAEFYARGFTGLRAATLAGLEKGRFEVGDLRFRKKAKTQLPAFLYLAFSAIFTDDGIVRARVNVDAVSCLNQLLAVFGKIEGGHTKESETTCINNFVKNEAEVQIWDSFLRRHHVSDVCAFRSALPSPLDRYKYRTIKFGVEDYIATHTATGKLPGGGLTESEYYNSAPDSEKALIRGNYLDLVLMEARRLVSRVLSGEDPRDLHPKHGSGASACGTLVNQRYGTPRYIRAIDNIWSYSDYFYSGASHLCDVMPGRIEVPGNPATHVWLDHLTEYTPCAKVLLVPKDARGPRLISCEPRETMWIQQGLLSKLVTCMEAHPLTSGLVNFTDQGINRYQAYRGSITRDLATLDLKDASDRVSLALVQALFPKNWFECLFACRSPQTALPNGDIVALSKHAPMGSALCFPVMALTIWSLLTATANMAQTEKSVRVSGRLQQSRKRFNWDVPVYVYGDDIIVPSSFAGVAKLVLESVGLTVNANKSYVHSSFRESCGGEYYDGWDVTPIRLRTLPDDDVPSRMRVIAFHNNVVWRYGAQPMWLTSLIHDWYPNVPERSVRDQLMMGIPDGGLFEIEEGLPRILVPGAAVTAHHLTSKQAALSSVLDVWRADNHRLPRRHRKTLCRTEFRFLSVVPKGIKYPKDRWCQVLRALVNPRHDQEFGWDALAKRVAYKYRWAALH